MREGTRSVGGEFGSERGQNCACGPYEYGVLKHGCPVIVPLRMYVVGLSVKKTRIGTNQHVENVAYRFRATSSPNAANKKIVNPMRSEPS